MEAFKVAEEFLRLDKTYPEIDELIRAAKAASFREQEEIIRLWVSEGIPYAFKDCPILYEKSRTWLANELNIHPKELTLIGSGRIGFSLACVPDFGRPFNSGSDLDFSAISEGLFLECERAFLQWAERYKKGEEVPRTKGQSRYWPRNYRCVPANLSSGFIDPYKIPFLDRYPIAQKIGDAQFRLLKKLRLSKNAPTFKDVSLRVYKNWVSFVQQLQLNLTYALDSMAGLT